MSSLFTKRYDRIQNVDSVISCLMKLFFPLYGDAKMSKYVKIVPVLEKIPSNASHFIHVDFT